MKISKQVIVMRKDLNMRKGKMIAQGSHACLKVILDTMFKSDITYRSGRVDRILATDKKSAIEDWIQGRFTKVCLYVESEKELDDLYNKAKEKGLMCSMIVDAGLTEFNGVPTKTCIAIGPNWSDEIDEITGHLKLL